MEKDKNIAELFKLSKDAPFNVKRVTDVDEIREAFRAEILDKKGIDVFAPGADKRAIAEPIERNIKWICENIGGLIVWGSYGPDGDLDHITNVREVKQLVPKDAKAFKSLYMDGLKRSPEVFGSTFENERERTVPEFKKFIESRYVVGVKHGYRDEKGREKENLVGIANLRRESGSSSHRAWFGTLYVHPAHRGRGLGPDITYHTLDHAGEQGVDIVRLVVTTTNKKIIPFYESLGFKEKEIQYDAVRIDGHSYDWLTMELRMKKYRAIRKAQQSQSK